MSTTFNSLEIQRQSSRVETETNNIGNEARGLANISSQIAQVVISDDSGLAGKWVQLSDTFYAVSTATEKQGEKLKTVLDAYVSKTIENEETVSEKTAKSGEGLNQIVSELESLF
ncbi:MAG: hypothetical protein RR732_04165 [Bacilli bacterium]